MNSIEVTAAVAKSLDQLQIPCMIVGAYSSNVWFPTPEDVVIQKLRWQRRKDLDDIIGILAVSGKTLDWQYLYGWAERHGTSDILKQLASAVQDLNLPPELMQ